MFRDDVDGKTLTFDRAGLKGSNFFMRDRETGSDWQQLTGECFEGPLKGKRLAKVPFLLTTWGEWRAQHPETLALVPEPAYRDRYQIMAQRIASLPYGSSRSPERGSIRQDPRLPAYTQVAGIEVLDAQKAYPLALLRKQTVLNDKVGLMPIVLVYSAASDTTTAFSRVLRGRTLTFHAAKPGSPGAAELLVDNETGSKWTAYGECTAGKLKGQKLDPIIPLLTFWFSWAEFFPEAQVYFAAEH